MRISDWSSDVCSSDLFTGSAYSSYSACRQYWEDIGRACEAVRSVGGTPPEVDKVRPYFNHPGFVLAMVERVHAALEELAPTDRNWDRLAFTAHSTPRSRSEEPTSESQPIMSITYTVFCW